MYSSRLYAKNPVFEFVHEESVKVYLHMLLLLLFLSHWLIRYESSRGHKIDGTKPNQTGNRR